MNGAFFIAISNSSRSAINPTSGRSRISRSTRYGTSIMRPSRFSGSTVPSRPSMRNVSPINSTKPDETSSRGDIPPLFATTLPRSKSCQNGSCDCSSSIPRTAGSSRIDTSSSHKDALLSRPRCKSISNSMTPSNSSAFARLRMRRKGTSC